MTITEHTLILVVLLMFAGIGAKAQTANQTITSTGDTVLDGDLDSDGNVNESQTPSYELVNDNAKAFLTEVDYSNDTQYLNSFVRNFRSNPVTDLTLPLPVTLKWQGVSGYESLKLVVSSDLEFSDAWVYPLGPGVDRFDVYNLIPNRNYYWKIEGFNGISETIIDNGQFFTTGSRRLFLIPGEYLGNCRDLGGLPCTGGTINQHVKYLSDSYIDEVQHVKDWIRLRLEWMDKELLNN